MRVRTGRFTRKEFTMMSDIPMGLHPKITDRDQPLGFQPLVVIPV
jgi:hypothetical protein